MANKYYNGVSLPEFPSGLDLTAYPNVIVSKVATDGSYVMWCITEATIYCYPSQQNFKTYDACTGIIYTATADAVEWTLSEEILEFTGATLFSYAGYEPFFAACNIMDLENYNYFLSASLPVDFYWDWSDTEGRIHATIVGESGGVGYYKILDNVYTYEQLLTMSGYMSVKGSYDTSMPFSAGDIDVKILPVIALGFVIVCPIDNCTITQGEMQITFPEKGVYSAQMIDGVDCTGGETGLNFPTAEPVVLYDGNVATVEGDGIFITQDMLTFTEPIAERDVLLTTMGTEHLDTVGVVSTLGWEYFGAEFDADFNPIFTDRKYLAVQVDAETATIGAFTESAMTGDMKVVRFLPGSVNKLSREFEFSIQNPIGVGQSFQIEITSDNASEEFPTYTYSTYGSNYTVSESGLVTGVKAGSYTLYVKAEATENYHELQKSISITIQEEPVEGGDSGEGGGEVTKTDRELSVTVEKSELYVEDMTQINVSDNASGDSPVYSYESSNTSVATVSDTGLITAVGEGTATITVTSVETTNYTEGTATLQITIKKVVRKYLEWIENTGATQYIDTGFKPNQDTRVVFHFLETGQSAYWFGAWNSTYNNGAYALCNDYYNIYSGYNGQGGGSGSPITGEHIVELNKNIVYIDGEVFRTFTETTFQVNYSLYLFQQNRKGTAGMGYGASTSTCKLVDCQIYDNGTLVRDFKPVQLGDGSIGLWDEVTMSFYGNSGTGVFTAGEQIKTVKYLVRNEGVLYTMAEGVLSALETTELTAQTFQTYGFENIPEWSVISGLVNPEILYWQDNTDDAPELTATMTATPNPQTLYAEPFFMTDATIFGIDSVDCTYEGNPLIALSFDGGAYEHYNNGWIASADNEGMLPEVLMAITQDVWEAKVSGVSSVQIRVILNSNTDTLQTIKFNFINKE